MFREAVILNDTRIVLDILDMGIDVYTTLNVQHLESRTDTVSQITGIVVRETVPDEIFEKADEIELVDITPDELLQRFADGKVYTPDQSAEAIRNFFKKGNITALREMSLRIVADRVDTAAQGIHAEKSHQRAMEIRFASDGSYWTKPSFRKAIAMGKESFLLNGSNTSFPVC